MDEGGGATLARRHDWIPAFAGMTADALSQDDRSFRAAALRRSRGRLVAVGRNRSRGERMAPQGVYNAAP
jgi:hypothetical protein